MPRLGWPQAPVYRRSWAREPEDAVLQPPKAIFQAKKEELPARGQPWGFSLKVLWETLVFDFAVTAPGAMALLGLAGLIGTRRRCR